MEILGPYPPDYMTKIENLLSYRVQRRNSIKDHFSIKLGVFGIICQRMYTNVSDREYRGGGG